MDLNLVGLRAAVLNFMVRAELTGDVDTFIQLGEAWLNRKLPLREQWITELRTGTIGSALITLPTGFIEPAFLKLTTFGEPQLLRAEAADLLQVSTVSRAPSAWAVDGGSIRLDSPCDQAHTFDFRYRRRMALSDAAPTNWLLTNHPDVYLAAVLVWGGLFIKKPDEAAGWKAILSEALAELSWIETRGDALATLSVDPALLGAGRFDIYQG